MFKKIHSVVWLFIFLLLPTYSGVWGSGGVVFEYTFGLEQADSLYAAGKYKPALHSYKKVIQAPPVKRDPATLFRIAYSAYKSRNDSLASALFGKLANENQFLPEYSGYFYLKSLWNSDTKQAVKLSEKYIKRYRKHSFADSLILPVAEYYFDQGHYRSARKYYLMAKSLGIDKNNNANFLIKATQADYLAGNKKNALQSYRQIMKRYPWKEATAELINNLRTENPRFVQENLFDVISVYTANKRFYTARLMLEDYLKDNPTQPEKARFLLTKIYYQRGKYRSALYGFKNLLNAIKDKRMEPHLRIYIARSYLRLGQKQKAIKLYLDYANRFPRRRLAAEAVWKSAWLAEEQNQPQKALEYYHIVNARWPRSEFAKEAYFREGFTYFRLGRYEQADKVFSKIRFKNWPDLHTNRAQYWSALCHEKMNDPKRARELRLEIAQNLWDNYYTMRSYLWDKAYIDSSGLITDADYPGGNPLLYYGSGIGRILDKIESAFQLRQLLGERYGKIALTDIKFSLKTREEWIALAEIYKKFADYGRAYEVYDLINRRFYADLSFSEKRFMLKERFPYYYDGIIEQYSKRYGVEKEFVLAIIKQESKYKSDARSWANAHGLMQIIPATAGDMGNLTRRKFKSVNQLYDPDYNIHLGSRYVRWLEKQFDGRKDYILAAYNAGPHRVKRWKKKNGAHQVDVFIENIEFAETRDYVRKVLKNYWAYKVLNDDAPKDEDILYGLND